MIDILDVIRDHLLLDSALYAAVGDGEYLFAGRNEPGEGYKPSKGGAIAFRVAGGMADYSDALFNVRIQAKCYRGQTATQATEMACWTLYRLLYDALHNTTGAQILHGEADTLGVQLYEPDTEWAFVLGFFMIQVRNTTI